MSIIKYNLIVDYLKKEISSLNITQGEKMPSIRELCHRFKCTKTTAVRAYYVLKEEGLVYAIPNSGYYLIENTNRKEQSNNIIDFSGTSLDNKFLPYSDFQSCLNQAITKYKEALFSYTAPQGLDSLIEVLRSHLQNSQIFSNSNKIFVTTGSQQALDLLSRMPFPNGKTNVVIEQPSYQGMIQCLSLNKITAIGVSRGFKGLDFVKLEKIFKTGNIKFFYTIPRFTNPLGLNYSKDDKKKLLILAEKYDVYIVEDDFLGDLESDSKSDPIFSYDSSERVVYLKTFSKVLLPGLRVAVVVLPKILTNTFREYKYWADINTPVISQGALEIYLSSGLFDAHIKKIRDLYRTRMGHLKELTDKESSQSIRWHIPLNGGFYAGIELLNGSKGKVIVENLSAKNIRLSSTEKYYLREFTNDKILRISVANVDNNAMESGIPAIIREIENSTDKYKRFIDL